MAVGDPNRDQPGQHCKITKLRSHTANNQPTHNNNNNKRRSHRLSSPTSADDGGRQLPAPDVNTPARETRASTAAEPSKIVVADTPTTSTPTQEIHAAAAVFEPNDVDTPKTMRTQVVDGTRSAAPVKKARVAAAALNVNSAKLHTEGFANAREPHRHDTDAKDPRRRRCV